MKPKLFFLAPVIMLALASIALAHAVSAGLDAALAPHEAATLSGGHYRLTNVNQGDARQENNPASNMTIFAGSNANASRPGMTTLSGGRYRLTGVIQQYSKGDAWQDSGLASGGGYHLKGPASPQLTGSGCCCMYLPCVQH
jgi:hypothetical protein